jgi:putative membrane protein
MTGREKHEKLDVDTRFLLANERTLLAWIRTSLAVEAGGVALAALHKQQFFLGVMVLLCGGVVALIGYHRFIAADRAIRSGKMPPSGSGPAVQVFGVVGIALLLAIAQITILK